MNDRTHWTTLAILAALGTGCTAESKHSQDEDAGAAIVALTNVPDDVSCIRISAAGASRTEVRDFDVRPMQSTAELMLNRLPVGLVTFEANAFETACAGAGAAAVPAWFSDPVDMTLQRGQVADVSLRMKRNGRSELSIDFADEELDPGTCSETNLALNTSGTGYPNPANESDAGWGGGSYPWDIVDGQTHYFDTWAHGLAFSGGTGNWNGQPCGERQATVDFGATVILHRALVWHHGDEHVPTTYELQYWNGSSWSAVGGSSSLRNDLRSDGMTWGAVPTEHLFPEVSTSKIRFVLDNCNITHGWLYELEAFGCTE